jgi:hypothetical protein
VRDLTRRRATPLGEQKKDSAEKEKESLKGRYKCRYCGEIKSNHRCPALIDVPRTPVATSTDLDLTRGIGQCSVASHPTTIQFPPSSLLRPAKRGVG